MSYKEYLESAKWSLQNNLNYTRRGIRLAVMDNEITEEESKQEYHKLFEDTEYFKRFSKTIDRMIEKESKRSVTE
jgi:hypothetical protein